MTGPMLADLLPLPLIAVIGWLLPRLQRPTLPFGVRIPPDRVTAPVVVRNIRAYRLRVAVTGIAIVAVTAVLLSTLGPATAAATVPALLLSTAGYYLLARKDIRRSKAAENWYAGARQAVVADTGLRTDPERVPWPWTLPVVAVVLVTAVVGIVLYPSMPAVIATNYKNGIADGFQAKSAFTVAVPVLIQVFISGLVVLIVAVSFRSRPVLDPAAPRRSSVQYRVFLRRISRAMLAMMTCVNLSTLLVWSQVWQGRQPGSWTGLASTALIALGVVGLIVVSVRTGQGGSRVRIPDGELAAEHTGAVERDDDRFWRAGGLCYVNKEDPSMLVPKRVGIGWTVNFGNPWGALVLVAPLVLILGITLLSSTHR